MAQWARMLATKSDDLSLVPEPNALKEKTNFFKLFPTFMYML